MSTKPNKKNQDSNSLQEQIVKLEKQLESFKHSNEHFLKNKLFLHYDIKEPEKVVVDCETKLPVLVEVDKKKIQKRTESDLTHLLIEGDNYHALSVLNYTHAGKVDVIYIDPPYNTGNMDFIYNDHFVDREDSFRHSKWLSFMAHRLRLAKNLLAETGVIFISIDDNEQAHLRLLCDQIFGEENFVANFTWIKKEKASGVPPKRMILPNKEYVLAFAKNAESIKFKGQERSLASYKQDEDGRWWRTMPIQATGNQKTSFIIVDPKTGNKYPGRWAFSEKKILEMIEQGKIAFPKSGKGLPTQIVYADEMSNQASPVFEHLGMFDSEVATKSVKSMFGGNFPFNFPKPVELIEFLVEQGGKKSAVILDFFAGSGTTGHAVLKLNAQDSGTRQFILCTNNENKIAEDVTYPRIKKVIDGYGDTAGIPTNLRYFKTDFVEKKGSVSQLKIDLTRQCAEMLCVKENVFEAVRLKKTAKNYRFFKNGNKYLGVFFDFFTDPEFTEFIAELNRLPQEAEKVVYIFVLDGSAGIFADEFAGVANCEVKEIPQKILDIYKQLAREVARK